MTTNTNEKAVGAFNTNGLHTETNNANFRSHGAVNQAHDDKAIANQIARLALAGHQVQRLEDGFLVRRWGMSRHCPDLESLAGFARQIGVKS